MGSFIYLPKLEAGESRLVNFPKVVGLDTFANSAVALSGAVQDYSMMKLPLNYQASMNTVYFL